MTTAAGKTIRSVSHISETSTAAGPYDRTLRTLTDSGAARTRARHQVEASQRWLMAGSRSLSSPVHTQAIARAAFFYLDPPSEQELAAMREDNETADWDQLNLDVRTADWENHQVRR
jgi:hypothetical protein